MAIEEPVGFTAEGKLVTAWRWTEAERADIFMANELHAASPDGQEQLRAALDSLPSIPGSITVSGYLEG